MTRVVLAVGILVALAGCEDPVQVGPAPAAPSGEPTASATPAAAAAEAEEPADERLSYGDETFVEAEVDNRDPFRGFARVFKAAPPERVQRQVVMGNTAVEEMRLVAIVTGGAQSRAMLVDPSGIGHVVKRGDFVGRPEIIQTGGADAMPVTLNWRIDRIRPAELVLTREDPTAPGRPPLTRVVPLHDEGDPYAQGGTITASSG